MTESSNFFTGLMFEPVSRRQLLHYLSGLGATIALSGCQGRAESLLKVHLLNKSIPPQFVDAFKRQAQGKTQLDFSGVAQLASSFEQLQQWKRQLLGEDTSGNLTRSPQFTKSPVGQNPLRRSGAVVPDLVPLGDYWLRRSIGLGLIAPLTEPLPQSQTPSQALPQTQAQAQAVTGAQPSEGHSNVYAGLRGSLAQALTSAPIDWAKLVTRSAQGVSDRQGQVWAAPYRWGSMAIVYRRDLLKDEPPQDWADLWHDRFKGKLILPDHPRLVIGLALKRLGYSYNHPAPDTLPELATALAALHRQVLTYSSAEYQPSLLLGDAWVAIGSSLDVLTMPQYGRQIGAIVPPSGSSLWAELWVRPLGAERTGYEAANAWIEFCWRSEMAAQLSAISHAASPVLVGRSRSALPSTVATDGVLLPPDAVLAKSEFIEPLTAEGVARYRRVWEAMRSA